MPSQPLTCLHELNIVEVGLAGQEIPIRRPRHPVLHLHLRRVKDVLSASGSSRRNPLLDHFPRALRNGDHFAPQKFTINHFDQLEYFVRLIGRLFFQALASKPVKKKENTVNEIN